MLKSKGFSLIEILLVLVISILIITSAFTIYNKVKDAQNISKVISQINQIREVTRQIYNLENSYVNINNNTLIKLDLIPKEMIKTNNDIINPYGGKVIISSSNGNENLRFNIIYYGVPPADCVKISSIINQSVWAIAVADGGSDIKHDAVNLRFSVNNAIQACNSVKDKETVNITFQSS